MYLLDTNIISAIAPARMAPPGLVAWLDAHTSEMYLSVVTVAEIDSGIAKNRREGAARKADELASWLESVLQIYGVRILGFDFSVARYAGALIDLARGAGHAPGFADIIIAATARHYGLTILSRNLRHFEPLGVKVLDPFAALP